MRRILIGADAIGITLAFTAAHLLVPADGAARIRPDEYLLFLASLPVWILLAGLYRLYEQDKERTDHSTVDEIVAVFHLVTVGAWFLFGFLWLAGSRPELRSFFVFWGLGLGFVTVARVAARSISRRRPAYVQKAIIVGAGDVGQLVARKLQQHPEYGIELLGFVDDEPRERRPDLGQLEILGSPTRLPELVDELGVERVLVAFSKDSPRETVRLIRSLQNLDVRVHVVPRLFEILGPSVVVDGVEGLPLFSVPAASRSRAARIVKRGIDIFGASIGLLVTAPLIAFFAWRIKRDSPGPVFFRQTRVGKEMREFTSLKFRTMRVGTCTNTHRAYIKASMERVSQEGNGLFKLDRGSEVTRVGRWLRKTSLDELPQLFNVLRGDMSLVGPRPCIPYEIEHFAPHHLERFLVPAGLTGLWQVTARANATFAEALDMDVAYARSASIGLDLRLLLRTPLQMIRQRQTA